MPADIAILAQDQGWLAKAQHETSDSAVPALYIEHLCKPSTCSMTGAQGSALHRKFTGLRIKVHFQVSLS